MEKHSTSDDDDELTLVPVYRFTWDDGSSRSTDTIDDPTPDAIEALAELGRADPECLVELIGMGG